jgi:hypothetical protein
VEQGFVVLQLVISRAVAIMSASLNLRYFVVSYLVFSQGFRLWNQRPVFASCVERVLKDSCYSYSFTGRCSPRDHEV